MTSIDKHLLHAAIQHQEGALQALNRLTMGQDISDEERAAYRESRAKAYEALVALQKLWAKMEGKG